MSVVSMIFDKYGKTVTLSQSDGTHELPCFICPDKTESAGPRFENVAPIGAHDGSRYLLLAPAETAIEDGARILDGEYRYTVLRAEKYDFPKNEEHWEASLMLTGVNVDDGT